MYLGRKKEGIGGWMKRAAHEMPLAVSFSVLMGDAHQGEVYSGEMVGILTQANNDEHDGLTQV